MKVTLLNPNSLLSTIRILFLELLYQGMKQLTWLEMNAPAYLTRAEFITTCKELSAILSYGTCSRSLLALSLQVWLP